MAAGSGGGYYICQCLPGFVASKGDPRSCVTGEEFYELVQEVVQQMGASTSSYSSYSNTDAVLPTALLPAAAGNPVATLSASLGQKQQGALADRSGSQAGGSARISAAVSASVAGLVVLIVGGVLVAKAQFLRRRRRHASCVMEAPATAEPAAAALSAGDGVTLRSL